MRKFSKRSQAKLDTCHPDIQLIAQEVLRIHDCSVIWGHRNKNEQERMVKKGASRVHYPRSKHNSYPSNAIDLAPYVPSLGGVVWDTKYSLYFAGLVLGVADQLYAQGRITHKIRWGGNWSSIRDVSFTKNTFYDGLHFELEQD